MKKVWIYKGLPASGKSTEAKMRVEKSNCGIVRVNKDSLREMLHSGKHSKGNEKFIIQARNWIIRASLAEGKHIIVDDTNLNICHEEAIRKIAKEYDAQVIVKWFEATPEECIKRDLKRLNSVGAKVIWEQYTTYIKQEEVKNTPKLVQDESLPHAIVVDIDGTVAIKGDRSPYDGSRVDEDTPNEDVIALIESYLSYSGRVIFLSGREDSCKEKTKEWIMKYIQTINGEWEIHMRKTGDNRKDSIIKRELFDEHVKDKFYVDFVLDDRLSVCRLWHSLGLTLLRVGDPDADF